MTPFHHQVSWTLPLKTSNKSLTKMMTRGQEMKNTLGLGLKGSSGMEKYAMPRAIGEKTCNRLADHNAASVSIN